MPSNSKNRHDHSPLYYERSHRVPSCSGGLQSDQRRLEPGRPGYARQTHEIVGQSDYRGLLLRTNDPLAPECLQFMEGHQADPELMHRARMLDQTVVEQVYRARR